MCRSKQVEDFLTPDLQPGQIEPIRWADNGEIVTPNAYRIGIPPQIRQNLLEYCDRLGATDIFRCLTNGDNDDGSFLLQPGTTQELVLLDDDDKENDGFNWFLQRPDSYWNSNMHWLSPMDEAAQDNYLRVLGAAGFDQVLDKIGKEFGYRGLAAYHVTFIAVSHCTHGYLHYDATETNSSVFNIIIPLILANETGPELDILQKQDTNKKSFKVGRLRYQYDVASLLGDDAYHATSAVDYRDSKEMRMAATIYVADIYPSNLDAILTDYTQHYPPQDRPDLLLAMAGKHWQANDPKAKLPRAKSRALDGDEQLKS